MCNKNMLKAVVIFLIILFGFCAQVGNCSRVKESLSKNDETLRTLVETKFEAWQRQITAIGSALPRWVLYPLGLGSIYYVGEQILTGLWRLVKPWILGKTTVDLQGRTITHHLASDLTSFVKELRNLDIVETVLKMLRVSEENGCRQKAACEAGAWFLHSRPFFAAFLRAMKLYMADMTKYFPDIMEGLKGRVCDEVFPRCARNFVMNRR